MYSVGRWSTCYSQEFLTSLVLIEAAQAYTVIHTAPNGTVFIAFWLMFLTLSCVAAVVFAGVALSAAAVRSRLLATTFEIVEYELLDNFSCPSDPEWKDIGKVGQKRSPQKVNSKGSRRFTRFTAKTEGDQDPNETKSEDEEVIPKSPKRSSEKETKSLKPGENEDRTQLDSKEDEEATNLKSESKTGRTSKSEK
nr:unnamed protein product [Haemonchus contortus]